MSRWGRMVIVSCVALGASIAVSATASASSLDRPSALDRALSEFDLAQEAQATDPGRARRMFRSAAQSLQSLIADGVGNGLIEYNLGNCHLQNGDIGRAILHYRRAQRLIPRDPLLKNNLSVARSRCITSISPSRRSAVLRSVFFWHYQTAFVDRLLTGGLLYIAFWVVLALFAIRRRRAAGVVAVVCAVLVLSIAASLMADHWGDRNVPEGVIMRMDVAVHSGPGSGYPRQFEQPLQPGTEFALRERRGDWWRIELPDGGMGWVAAAAAELIIGNNL